MYRKRTNQLKRMKTTENIKLHIIHCKLVYLFALVWLLFHSTPLLHKSGKFQQSKEQRLMLVLCSARAYSVILLCGHSRASVVDTGIVPALRIEHG